MLGASGTGPTMVPPRSGRAVRHVLLKFFRALLAFGIGWGSSGTTFSSPGIEVELNKKMEYKVMNNGSVRTRRST